MEEENRCLHPQETHLEGDYTKIMNKGFVMIHHGPPKQPKNGAKGGVAIIISKELDEGLRKAGNKMRQGGINAGNTTRLLGINVHFKLESNSKRRHAKTKRILIISCYHPTSMYNEEQATKFNDKVAQMLNSLAKSHTIIMGLDINVAISNSTTDDNTNWDFTLIGLHGNKFRNKQGDMIQNIMQLHNLKSTTMFFKNKGKVDTWIHLATRKRYQLDHILISSKHFQSVKK